MRAEMKTRSKVILVIIDGLDAREMARMGNVDILTRPGVTLRAVCPRECGSEACVPFTALTSRTLQYPGSVLLARLGNSLSLFDLLHQSGCSTASFSVRRSEEAVSLDELLGPLYASAMVSVLEENAQKAVTSASKHIVSDKPDFCLIHLSDTEKEPLDFVPRTAKAGVAKYDDILGNLINAMSLFGLFGLYHVVLLGHAMARHGTGSPEGSPEFFHPWVIYGKRVREGIAIYRPVSTLDIAPTLARVMGLSPLPYWEGVSVEEVFSEVPLHDPMKRTGLTKDWGNS